MWAHKGWQGVELPAGLSRDEQLPAYATWCTAVEGNTTAYGVPAAATLQAWAAATPPEFRFWFKLPQTITHQRRLRGVAADVHAFAGLLAPFGARAETLVVQLPGSFGPTELDALAAVLADPPAGHRFAVEVRHPAFFDGGAAGRALTQLLERNRAEWLTFDTTAMFASPPTSDAEREAWSNKPRLPRRVVALTDRPAVRLLGRDDVAATVAGWQPWIPVVAGWLAAGREPTVFVHTPDNDAALGLARRFHAEVRAAAPVRVEPLPEPMVAQPTTLF
jgi:uncharacterized protein YecE (DUF72 family)